MWRYKRLANENVKEPKVNEKLADDEDYSSCFKLRKSLKVKLIFLFTTMHRLVDVKQS